MKKYQPPARDLTPFTLRELAKRVGEFGLEAVREELQRRVREGIQLDPDRDGRP